MSNRLLISAVAGLAFLAGLPGCSAPHQGGAGQNAPAASAPPPAPVPVASASLGIVSEPVPPAPLRGLIPQRPAVYRAAVDLEGERQPALKNSVPEQGKILPGPVQDALSAGLAEGQIVEAAWNGRAARFELGVERQAIRVLPFHLAQNVSVPGPVELVAEPLSVVRRGPMRVAPDGASGHRRALVEGETIFAFALTGDRAWMLVGQDGVVLGYAEAPLLAPLGLGGASVAASRLQEVADPVNEASVAAVPAATRCRALVIATSGALATEEACLNPGGEWRIAVAR